MKPKQFILIGGAVILTVAIFLVRHKPVQESPIHKLLAEARDTLPASEAERIKELEEKWAKAGDEEGAVLKELEQAWTDAGNPAMAGIFAYQYAEMDSTFVSWKHAGDRLIEAFRYGRAEKLSPNLIHFFVVKATGSYENALRIEENDVEAKVGLAIAYTDGRQEVMKGVQMLLEVLEQEPGHVEANQILGRYAMISGQYSKAVSRLETVLEKDPGNVEALFYLGEAYQALENTEKALYYWQKALPLAENDALKKEIGSRIQQIKN